jgi:autotransporter-associated beta strand protein
VPPGEDSVTIPGFTVTVYASPTGLLGDGTAPAGTYYVGDPENAGGAYAVGLTDANGEDCLTATPDNYERTVTLPASALNPTDLFCPNGICITDIYLLADIHFDGDTSSAGDILIRFEGGAFQTSDGTVWALGSASLDDTSPDGNDPNTITISGGQDALTVLGSGGPQWDPISYNETFASATSVQVAGHAGDNTIDGRGMGSAIDLLVYADGGSNVVYCSGGANSESWVTLLGDGGNRVYCSSAGSSDSDVSLGDGNNTVYGGAAASYIGAGNGDNTFYLGAAATDSAFAGCGNNTFIVSADSAGYTEIGGDADGYTLVLKFTTSSPPADLSGVTLPDGYLVLPSGRAVDYTGIAEFGLDFETGDGVGMPLVPPGTDVTVGSGTTLDLGGQLWALGTVTLDGGAIQNGSISADAYDLQSGTISANLGGDGGVTVDGGAGDAVLLSGQNSYAGGTQVDGGTLVLGSSTALPNGGDVWLSSPSPRAPTEGWSLPEGEGSPALDLVGSLA